MKDKMNERMKSKKYLSYNRKDPEPEYIFRAYLILFITSLIFSFLFKVNMNPYPSVLWTIDIILLIYCALYKYIIKPILYSGNITIYYPKWRYNKHMNIAAWYFIFGTTASARLFPYIYKMNTNLIPKFNWIIAFVITVISIFMIYFAYFKDKYIDAKKYTTGTYYILSLKGNYNIKTAATNFMNEYDNYFFNKERVDLNKIHFENVKNDPLLNAIINPEKDRIKLDIDIGDEESETNTTRRNIREIENVEK